MSSHLSHLAQAIQYYDKKGLTVDLNREISNEEFVREFCEIPQEDYGLDILVECLPAGINDEEYERPEIVRILMLADTDTGIILGADTIHPDEVEGETLI